VPEKKIALVTGANRGIGREIARQLTNLGWQVIVTAREEAKAGMAAGEIGKGAIGVVLDVADEESVRRAADEVQGKFGKLDVLVNNAGIIGNRSMVDFDLGQINSVMNTNFMGPIRTSKYFLPMLKKSNDGRIINISSGMGELASLEQGGYAAYRLSKTSLNAFTILLASELRNSSVKVMAMCPGWVKTDMGGAGATRPVEKGAETAVWLATSVDVKSGKSYRDRKVIGW
jgi:NAD(P)-dependent dehydrogenase (short-subunit alcohol dehydrogenase family)